MNEVHLEIHADGHGEITMRPRDASNIDVINTLVHVLAAVCAEVTRDEATDKTKLIAGVCVKLHQLVMNPPKYTVGDDDEQKEG